MLRREVLTTHTDLLCDMCRDECANSFHFLQSVPEISVGPLVVAVEHEFLTGEQEHVGCTGAAPCLLPECLSLGEQCFAFMNAAFEEGQREQKNCDKRRFTWTNNLFVLRQQLSHFIRSMRQYVRFKQRTQMNFLPIGIQI